VIRFCTVIALTSLCLATSASAGANKAHRVALGAQIYTNKCSLCHDNSEHMINDIGPALFGVVGRRVGSVDGYNYSTVLMEGYARGDVWTPAALDTFLNNPDHVRPGTGMPFMIKGAKERAGVIAYLKTLRAKP
jgi:cytochrome c